MPIRKTQCGWMVLGGFLCLSGLALVCKVRDGNKAVAQAENYSVVPTVPVPTPATVPAEDPKKPELAKPHQIVRPDPRVVFKEPDEPLPSEGTSTLMPLGEPTKPLPPLEEKAAPAIPTVAPMSTGEKPTAATPVGSPLPVAPSTTKPSATEAKIPSPPMDVPTSKPVFPSNPDPSPPPMSPAPSGLMPVSGSAPTMAAPASVTPPPTKSDLPGEPPLAQRFGPLQAYYVHHEGETLRDIARRTLGSAERCDEIVKLNPSLKADSHLNEGTVVKLPADACIPTDEVEMVKPLLLPRKPAHSRVRALPLTGTYPCNLDDKHTITLPRAMRDQLGQGDLVMLSPGPDQCLWLTNQAHLDRLAERLDQSPAHEAEVRVFKRLYFAQTEKVAVSSEGRVQISEKLAQFAGLHQEVVLVGIDDHFELWDVSRWKQYTQQKSAAARASMNEE